MKTLRIGTFNIQHGQDHVKYLESKQDVIDLPRVASLIRAEGLDICAMNEVRNEENTAVAVNQAKVIGEALGYHYYFAKAINFRGGAYGNAIVSRYPIVKTVLYPIATAKEERVGKHYYEDRVLLAADIDVDGEIVTFLVCHYGLAPLEQERAVAIAREVVQKAEHPVVYLGDFNVTPASDVYAQICTFLTDAADGGDNFTFPSHAPSRKIDYIFTGNGASAKDFRICPEVVSDHCAITVELTFGA
ncbi:MAG: endonuclease/exonuclease/phosphatase family protein [Clostridia bacterium]|nr:endonuclease/exonuclease/phosphatase family protein [Clostridia bacterium]